MRVTFRKDKKNIAYEAQTYTVNVDGQEMATIQSHARGKVDAWFWYGQGQNTCDRVLTLEEAKVEIKAFFKQREEGDRT